MLILDDCIRCGVTFARHHRSKRKHCSEACKKADRQDAKPRYARVCARTTCAREFVTATKNKIYCCPECKKAHELEKFRATLRYYERRCAYEECGIVFTGDGRRTRYCCKKHAKMQKAINDRRRLDAHNAGRN